MDLNELNPKVIIYFIAGYESHGHGSNWPAKNEIDVYDWYDKLLETEGLSKPYKLLVVKAYLLYFQPDGETIEPERLFSLINSDIEAAKRQVSKLKARQGYSASKMTPTNMNLMAKTAPLSLVELKNRKMKKQARKDVKNVKQVIVAEGVTDEYNIDKILEELGESQSKKNPTNKKSNNKTKADRKRSGNMTINGKKDKSPGVKLEHNADNDTTGAVEEDNEELVEQSQSDANGQEHISSTNQTVLPELASQAAMSNQQTSESTEDMFTPVISKNSKRWNKKVGISNLSIDDLAQTSSSLTSSTTLSAMAASSSQNTSYAAPVISKHSKRRNKKAGISNLSKDDLPQTSSSLASSTTSSAITASSSQNTSYAAPVISKQSKQRNKKAEISNLCKDNLAQTSSSTTASAMAASSGQNTSSAAASSYSSILSAKPANVEMLNVAKFEENLKIVEEQTSEFKHNDQGLIENLDQNSKLEGKIQDLEGKIQKIEESRLCKICLDREVSQIFLPCGHTICCKECAMGIQICPICRENIQKSQKIYFS